MVIEIHLELCRRLTSYQFSKRRLHDFIADKNLEENVPLDVPHDFTEELWLTLQYCHSNQDLTKALRYIFDALKAGYKNTLVSFPASSLCFSRQLSYKNAASAKYCEHIK